MKIDKVQGTPIWQQWAQLISNVPQQPSHAALKQCNVLFVVCYSSVCRRRKPPDTRAPLGRKGVDDDVRLLSLSSYTLIPPSPSRTPRASAGSPRQTPCLAHSLGSNCSWTSWTIRLVGTGGGEATGHGSEGLLRGGRNHLLLLLLLRHGHGHHGDAGADGHAHADEAAEGDDGERSVHGGDGRHRAERVRGGVFCRRRGEEGARE